MIKKLKNKVNNINNQKGMSTIEVIFLIAVLISLAILFGTGMKTFVKNRIDQLNDGDYFDMVTPKNISYMIDTDSMEKLEGASTIKFISKEMYFKNNREA